MNEIFVANLEANIQKIVDVLNDLTKTTHIDREEEIKKVLESLSSLKTEPLNLKTLEDKLEAILEKLSEEEVQETDEATPVIVASLEAINSSIRNLEETDLTLVESKLQTVIDSFDKLIPKEIKFPDEYPLPKLQIEQLKSLPDLVLRDKIDEVNSLLREIKELTGQSSGGGGSDVVGLKNEDSNGRPVRVNVMTDETGQEIVTAIESITIPAPVGGATEAKQDVNTLTIIDLYNQMALLLDRLEFGLMTDSSKKLKVNLSETALATITTVTNVTTIATLSALTNQVRIGDVQAQRVVEAQLDTAFNLGIIRNITF